MKRTFLYILLCSFLAGPALSADGPYSGKSTGDYIEATLTYAPNPFGGGTQTPIDPPECRELGTLIDSYANGAGSYPEGWIIASNTLNFVLSGDREKWNSTVVDASYCSSGDPGNGGSNNGGNTHYLDTDDDGDGYTENQGDCNDAPDGGHLQYPGNIDTCGNGIDEDCNGSDEPCPVDADNDGYDSWEDCNDNDPNINPGAEEICNAEGVDENCDGVTEYCPNVADVDGDGYNFRDDCNDNDPDINPGMDEICDNNVDDDCDGVTDGNDSECGGDYGDPGDSHPDGSLPYFNTNSQGDLDPPTVGDGTITVEHMADETKTIFTEIEPLCIVLTELLASAPEPNPHTNGSGVDGTYPSLGDHTDFISGGFYYLDDWDSQTMTSGNPLANPPIQPQPARYFKRYKYSYRLCDNQGARTIKIPAPVQAA